MDLVLEIAVLKKIKEHKILLFKEECAMTYGGECGVEKFCALCAIKDEVKQLQVHFDSRNSSADFGKAYLGRASINSFQYNTNYS